MRLAIVIALSCSIGAYADTVNAPGSSWYSNAGAVANNTTPSTGPSFWDNPSYDGDKCNGGYFLAGTNSTSCSFGSSAISPAPGNLRFLASSSSRGVGAPSMTFTPGGTNTGTFSATFTGFSGIGFGNDVFGWTDDGGMTLHPLFTVGVTTLGTTVDFTPSGSFQYYISNGFGQNFLSGVDGKQFALFSENPSAPTASSPLGTYWIAAEDTNGPRVFPWDLCLTPGCGSDYDFNDVIVKIVSPLPLTTTLDAPYQVRYASNLTLADSIVNITNTGANGAPLYGPGFGGAAGNICVNVYAFSPDEQLISCCSCLVTPNGLVHLTANNDLVSNTLTGVSPNSIVIKLVATATGVEEPEIEITQTSGYGAPTFTGSSCNNSAALVGTNEFQIASGMLAWGTTSHSDAEPVNPNSLAITETPFLSATLSHDELKSIRNRCTNIVGNGSTFGICRSCRQGGLGGSKL